MEAEIQQIEMLEQVECDLCGASESKLQLEATDWHFCLQGEFAIVQCAQCGLSFTSPRPKPQSMGQYYPSSYYTHESVGAQVSGSQGDLEVPTPSVSRSFIKQCIRSVMLNETCGLPSKIAGWSAIALQRRKTMTPWRWGLFQHQGRLLDVGCGGGVLLSTLNSDWLLKDRYIVQGIDIDEAAVQCARNLGVDAHVHDFPNTLFAETEFDVVTMRHSLEHMYSPKAAIQEIYRLLRPGGTIIIEVPNFDSWGRRIFGDRWSGTDAPRHLYHFTLLTLRQLLESNGFTVTARRRWPSRFHGHLSLDNQRRCYRSQGLSKQAITRKLLFWRTVLWPFDWFTSGGAISMSATRA